MRFSQVVLAALNEISKLRPRLLPERRHRLNEGGCANLSCCGVPLLGQGCAGPCSCGKSDSRSRCRRSDEIFKNPFNRFAVRRKEVVQRPQEPAFGTGPGIR
jgi:hypothetical protein